MQLQRKRLARNSASGLPLIRPEVLAARREPLHGVVGLAMPPGTVVTTVLAFATVVLLAFAAWVIEIPNRVPAVGVLMPPEGFVRLVAARAGRVTAVHVREGERVAAGQRLVEVTSDGGAVTAGDSVPHATLRSLHAELALQRRLAQQAKRAREVRGYALDQQIAGMSQELERVQAEIELQAARADLIDRRLARVRSLTESGDAARVRLEDAQLEWLAASATIEALRRQAVRIEQERGRLREARAALAHEARRDELSQAIAAERLQRQIPDAEAHVGLTLRAPRPGVIARLMVRSGQPVAAGETVATVRQGSGHLEAWLYLPTARAGALAEGQAVELRFDAWPSRVYGTQSATITSISAMALMPSDLDVPVALAGPVFEVRATLERQAIVAGGRRWPLAAGTAVRADLVQRRQRLYQWLLRVGGDTGRAPADA